MSPFFVILVGFVIVGVCNLVVWAISEEFFNALISKYPHLKDSFPRPPWWMNNRYGPIRPSKMSYLKTREFSKLPEPELRELGGKALRALRIYQVIFFIYICSFFLYVFFSPKHAP
jgi:predicted PurR-regulated permease PerM